LLKDKLETYKVELSDVLISEDYFLELRSIPEDSRNLKEFVLVKVYECVHSYQKQLEKSRRESENLRENLGLITENLHKEKSENEMHKRILNEREVDFQRRIEGLEKKNRDLDSEHRKGEKQIESLQLKGVRFDEM
jgi:hypothetical protein